MTNDHRYNWYVFALASAAYLIGLAATVFNPPCLFDSFVLRPVFSSLWTPIAAIIALLSVGFLWVFPAVPASIAFNCWGSKFVSLRLCTSSALLAALYAVGNTLHFRVEQWYWLHTYMCGYLCASGLIVPKLRGTNWGTFAMLIFVVLFFRHAVPMWRTMDYVWSAYFLFVSQQFGPCQSSRLPAEFSSEVCELAMITMDFDYGQAHVYS